MTSQKQIDQYRKKLEKEMEERKANFEENDRAIQGRISKLSSSKERMVEAIK